MRGNVSRCRRRAGSVLLLVGVALAFGMAVVLASASSVMAKSTAVHARPSVAAAADSHAAKGTPAVKPVITRTAGHKIA